MSEMSPGIEAPDKTLYIFQKKLTEQYKHYGIETYICKTSETIKKKYLYLNSDKKGDKVMPIKNIIIQNIKGISQLKIESEILKNRPNILVAPNGFGKTSIATAFKCAVDQTSIKLDDEDRYQQDSSKQATIELEVEENGEHLKLGVTEKAYSNDIRKYFDIHVISDLRKIKNLITVVTWRPYKT
nr:hypothetical protein [uncultured Sphaerochaeta sp.]